MNPASTRIVVLVAIAAVVLPALYRILRSPILLILLSPVFLLLTIFAMLAVTFLVANALDVRRANEQAIDPLTNAARPLAFATPAAWQAVVTRSGWTTSIDSLPPVAPSLPSVSVSLNSLIRLLVETYVLPWYSLLSPSPSFPSALEVTIHHSLRVILSRVSSQDVLSLLVRRILPIITNHIDKFREAEISLRGADLERHLTQSEELDLMLAARYAALGGKLHPAVANIAGMMTRQSEEAHLRSLVEKALPLVLPESEAGSTGVRIMAREIVACVVLLPVMDMLADPDFWNRALDQVASAAIQQQKLISKVRQIVQTQSSRPSAAGSALSPGRLGMEDITLRTHPKHFESFLKSISRCDSLLDARRLKNDVMNEIRRTRLLLANHEKEEWINGEKTEGIVKYLDRLYTAKRQVEKRIALLGGADDSELLQDQVNPSPTLSLRTILSNPSSLSYFMEFMDRRSRSLPVQFWLTVESFKDPLESVGSDSDSSSGEEAIRPRSETLKEDVSMIHNLYFASPTPSPSLAAVSQRHRETIKSFVNSDTPASAKDETKVRRAVLLAQRQMEEDMEGDFEDFKRSDLWFKAVSDVQGGANLLGATQPAGGIGTREKSPPPGLMHRSTAPPGGMTTSAIKPAEQSGGVAKRRRVLPAFIVPPGKLGRADTSPAVSANQSRLAAHHRTLSGNSSDSLAPSFDSAQSEKPKLVSSNLDLLIGPPDGSDRAPLFDDPRSPAAQPRTEDEVVESETIEAIQAALTDMIADETRSSLTRRGRDSYTDGRTPSGLARRSETPYDDGDDASPALPEPEQDYFDSAVAEHIRISAPGDPQFGQEIARLGEKITNLKTQETILDALVRKAELTGDMQELKLLSRSKSAMTRDLRELTFQRDQYIQQEANNVLVPDRTKATIVSSVMNEEDGKQVVKYLIQVQQLAEDGTSASGWVTARRYSEFWALHQRLREKYAAVKSVDLPGKKLVTSTSSAFVDARRLALERYLQSLIAIPPVCECDDLRSFLSRETKFDTSLTPHGGRSAPSFLGQDLMRTMYRSVAGSIDDMFFGPSMLDVMIQRLTQQAAEFAGVLGAGAHDEDLIDHAMQGSGKTNAEETLRRLPAGLKPLEGESSTSSFSRPICDLILSIFELNDKNNWLRRQAIVIILQQVLGSTIERKLRETMRMQLEESKVMGYLNLAKETMWPDGKPRPPAPPRTAEEKARTRDDANRKLSALMPDLVANMIGRSNARRGARRMFAVLQNRRLNQHIMYTIVDEVFAAIFPEASR